MHWFAKFVVTALPPGLFLCGSCTKKNSPAVPTVATERCRVEDASITQRVTTTGAIASARRWLLTPPYNGYLKKIYVKQGQTVQQDTEVALFSQTLSRDDQSFPVKAPFTGVVSHVMRNEGEALLTTDKGYVVRLDDLSKIFVDVKLGESERGKVKLGQKAIVRVNALPNKTFNAQLEQLSLATVEGDSYREKNDFALRAKVLDQTAELLPGMTVLMDIIIEKIEGIPTLSHECIQRDEKNTFVMLKDGTRVNIETGLQDEQRAHIKSGLKTGDVVQITDFAGLIKDK